MPKDNRRIHSAIRHGSTTYKDGMEDELAAAASQEQLERLASRGAISGDWTSAAPAVEAEETAADVEEAEVEVEVEEETVEEAAPKPKRGSKKAAPKK